MRALRLERHGGQKGEPVVVDGGAAAPWGAGLLRRQCRKATAHIRVTWNDTEAGPQENWRVGVVMQGQQTLSL
jgi:hypothetical protein